MDTTISLLEFCQNIQAAIARVEGGDRLTVLRDGKPVMRLEPAVQNGAATAVDKNADIDPIFKLPELAEKWIPTPGDESLSPRDIDRIIYDL